MLPLIRYLIKKNRLLKTRFCLAIYGMFIILGLPMSSNAQAVSQESNYSQQEDSLYVSLSDSYNQANDLYNSGEYQKAIDICQRIVTYYVESSIIKFSEESLVESAHVLIANCYVMMKEFDLAELELQKIIHMAKKGRLPMKAAAKAQLKISNIYYQIDDFLSAQKGYLVIIDNYPTTDYVDYAKERIEEINSQKVGELVGKVFLKNQNQHEGIAITIFNGFCTSSITTKSDGSYSVPFFKSTNGTFLSVYASKEGYLPQVRNVSVKGEIIHRTNPITLLPMDNPNLGVIIGVCFKTIQGGKLKPRYGLSSYDVGLEIEITGKEKQYNVKCTQQGYYLLLLKPGSYNLVTERGYVAEDIKVKRGETTICNLSSGRIMHD